MVASLSTPDSTTTANGDGTFTLRQYQTPINYQKSDGSWAAIDTTLVDAHGDTYAVQNAAADYTAKIPQDPATTPVDFSHDGAWVTMRMHGAADVAPTVDGSTATLDDVAKTDGVTYQALTAGLKEDIHLDTPPTDASGTGPATSLSYVYDLATSDGLTPSIDGAGNIDFTAVDGSVPVVIPAAVMHDSAAVPAESTAIAYTLAPRDGGWTLTLTPDLAWLDDPARVYPVVIDPTLAKQYDSGDCYIQSAVPDTAECGDGAVWLRAGGPDPTHRLRSLVKFNVYQIQQALPTGAVVTQAKAMMHMASGLNSTAATYAMYQAGAPFDNYATWNSSGGVGGPWVGGSPIASTVSSNTFSLSGGTPGYRGFDVTNTVQGWLNGTTPNNGLVLTQTIGTNVNNEILFESGSPYNTADVQPYLDVTYTAPPATPTGFTASPGGAGYTTSLTPTLSATVRDPQNDPLDVTFTLTDDSGDTVWTGTSSQVPAGTTASVAVPDDVLGAGQTYTIAIQASNGVSASATYTTSFATDLYGASVPAQQCVNQDDDNCAPTNSSVPIYSSNEIDPGQTAALPADPVVGVDMNSAIELFGAITTSTLGSGTGSLYIYDGDYAQPAVSTIAYAAGPSTESISLTPADDGSLTVYNDGTAPIEISITVATVQTAVGGTTDPNDPALADAAPVPFGSDVACTPTQMAELAITAGATETNDAAPDQCTPTPAGFGVVNGQRAMDTKFADPGFLNAGNQYYLYRSSVASSGDNDFFDYAVSGTPESGYSSPRASMVTLPAWVSSQTTDGNGSNLWAPDVFWNGSKYVMYFTGHAAINLANTKDHNCIGVATASTPKGPFVPVKVPLWCDPQQGTAQQGYPGKWYEAIDPTAFQSKYGNRYMVYKASLGNRLGWTIKYIAVSSDGTSGAWRKFGNGW